MTSLLYNLLSIVIVLALIVIVIWFVRALIKSFVIVPPNKIMKRFGAGKSVPVSEGWVLVLPYFHKTVILSLDPFQPEFEIKGIPSLGRVPVNIKMRFTARIGANEDSSITQQQAQSLAFQNFGSDSQVAEIAKGMVEGDVYDVVAVTSVEDLAGKQDEIHANIREAIKDDFNKVGLEIVEVSVLGISDDTGVFKNLAAVKAAGLERDANVAQAEARKTSQLADLDAVEAVAKKNTEIQKAKQAEALAIAKATRVAAAEALKLVAEQDKETRALQAEALKIYLTSLEPGFAKQVIPVVDFLLHDPENLKKTISALGFDFSKLADILAAALKDSKFNFASLGSSSMSSLGGIAALLGLDKLGSNPSAEDIVAKVLEALKKLPSS